ncbi:phage tail protein [Escherichia coli]|nr:phage tail protein [Escherichia coli]
MAGTNDFKAFATDANANVTSQEEWETLTALKKGFSSGKASSAQVSKALRQPSTMAAVLGQFIANAELDALDDGDVDGLVAKLATAITTNLGLGEAAKSRVLQSGGDSVKDVMSQNAITYLLSLKAGVNGERVEAENFREALNLGNAALKNTGTGQGQLPDMSAFLSNQEVNGYQYLPGGLILQWGSTPCEDRRTTVSKFPIPFPNECLMVIVCGFQVAGTYQAYTVVNGEWNDQFSWNAFYAQSGNIPVLAAAGQVNARFLAIGR